MNLGVVKSPMAARPSPSPQGGYDGMTLRASNYIVI